MFLIDTALKITKLISTIFIIHIGTSVAVGSQPPLATEARGHRPTSVAGE